MLATAVASQWALQMQANHERQRNCNAEALHALVNRNIVDAGLSQYQIEIQLASLNASDGDSCRCRKARTRKYHAPRADS